MKHFGVFLLDFFLKRKFKMFKTLLFINIDMMLTYFRAGTPVDQFQFELLLCLPDVATGDRRRCGMRSEG